MTLRGKMLQFRMIILSMPLLTSKLLVGMTTLTLEFALQTGSILYSETQCMIYDNLNDFPAFSV